MPGADCDHSVVDSRGSQPALLLRVDGQQRRAALHDRRRAVLGAAGSQGLGMDVRANALAARAMDWGAGGAVSAVGQLGASGSSAGDDRRLALRPACRDMAATDSTAARLSANSSLASGRALFSGDQPDRPEFARMA